MLHLGTWAKIAFTVLHIKLKLFLCCRSQCMPPNAGWCVGVAAYSPSHTMWWPAFPGHPCPVADCLVATFLLPQESLWLQSGNAP